MTPYVRQWVAETVGMFPFVDRRVLEIGSLDVNGGVRDLFSEAQSYLGIDRIPGPGVDLQMDAHDLSHQTLRGKIDDVVCLETLEHDPAFWVTLYKIRMLLRRGGRLMLSVPRFEFVHHHPPDYWRFSEEALSTCLLGGFTILRLDSIPGAHCGLGVIE